METKERRVSELWARARELGIPNPTSLKREELLSLISSAESEGKSEVSSDKDDLLASLTTQLQTTLTLNEIPKETCASSPERPKAMNETPIQSTTYSYDELIHAIQQECSTITLTYSKSGDGRITSAIKEMEYLNLLEKKLKEKHPSLVFEHQPVERWWWDFRVNSVPFNLKLTTGGTDNAFNKVAIIYTLTGKEIEKRNMNYNQFFKTIKDSDKKSVRNPMSEYHYLVVNKDSGKILLKSILDIHTYKSNPCNDLQINWANEFKHIEYQTPSDQFKEKIRELLKTIQKSVKQAVASMNEFANSCIDDEFPN
jgi:hypothetical protein